MLVICVRRKYVTLIYDLPGRGGGIKFCLESRKLKMFPMLLPVSYGNMELIVETETSEQI